MNWQLKTHLLPVIALALLSVWLLSFTLNKPFIGHHDWNGVQYGNMAKNYVRYGYRATKFGQVENYGPVTNSNFNFNTHYLAFFPILLSVPVKLFGPTEWAIRIFPLIFSVVGVIALYFLTFNLTKNRFWSVVAALFLLATPMFRYFANMPVHEPLIAAMSVLVTLSYFNWLKGNASYGWYFIIQTFTLLLGWPGFYLVPILHAHFMVAKRNLGLKYFLPLYFSAFAIFGLFLVHNAILTGSPFGGGLIQILKFRLNQTSAAQNQVYGFTLSQFVLQELRWLMPFFTSVQIALSAFFAISLILVPHLRQKFSLVIALLIFGVTHALIFPNAAFIHDYMIYYLTPGIALAAALGLKHVVAFINHRQIKYLPLLLLLFVPLSFIERNAFYQAMKDSNMHQIGKQAGEEIAAHTKFDDVIVIHSLAYARIFSKFTGFYADRHLEFRDFHPSDPPIGDYQVIIKSHPPDYEVGDAQYRQLKHILIKENNGL